MVGQALWRKDRGAAFAAISALGSNDSVAALLPELQGTPRPLQPTIKDRLAEVLRSRSAELIAAAYEDIAVENAAALLGLDANAALDCNFSLNCCSDSSELYPCVILNQPCVARLHEFGMDKQSDSLIPLPKRCGTTTLRKSQRRLM